MVPALRDICAMADALADIYGGMKREIGVLDFSDLEQGALRALRE